MDKKTKKIIDSIELFVLDMDGTIYLGDKLIPGALEFVETAKRNRRVIFFTNNASKVSEDYYPKLKSMGFKVSPKDIITSGDVTIEFLKTFYPEKRVYLNGTPTLENSFKGITLVETKPDVVIQSFDTTLNYEKLQKITDFIREDIDYLATHCDINCPTETGFMPDCGAICALIEASTGKEPRYLGKPNKEVVDMITQIYGIELDKIAFIGDRIYTDVATGVNNGAIGILVLSGESDLKTVKESDIKPTLIFNSVKEIIPYLN